MPDTPSGAAKKPLEESMLATATYDAVPRVGIILSSFKEGAEHDGTPIPGLDDPQPVEAPLNAAQTAAMLAKARELSQRTGGRGGRTASASDDWVVFLITRTGQLSADPLLLGALMTDYAQQARGRRFTVAGGGPAPDGYGRVIADLAKNYPKLHFEYADLATEPYLQVPAARRTFAQRNPEGVYAIPKVIRECDRLISVAPLQTSAATGVALTVANYWALAPAAVYGSKLEGLFALGDPADVLIDLYLHHPADFAVLGGPVHRDAAGEVRHNIVIAGANAVSVDTVGASVMGFDPLKLPLLDLLEKRGFGVADADAVWTRGNEVEEARRPFRKPAAWENV